MRAGPRSREWRDGREHPAAPPPVAGSGAHAYNASMSRESLLGTFEQLVLSAVLQVGESAYPPLILEWLVETTGRDVNRGSLYVTLDRLEKKGLLRSRRGDGSEARQGRPKRYLAVTPDGREALRIARSSLLASWEGIDELLGEAK